MAKKASTGEKKANKKHAGAASSAGKMSFASVQKELAALEKEIVAQRGNKSMEDVLEDKVDALEDRIDDAVDRGELTKEQAAGLEQTVDRLDDLLD